MKFPKLVLDKYCNCVISGSVYSEGVSEDGGPIEHSFENISCNYQSGGKTYLSDLYVGATVLITNQSMTDRAFWTFIKEQEATSFTGVPYSYEILNLMRFFRMDLPKLKVLTQGGGKMPMVLNKKFVEYCKTSGKQWIATYGQSEGTARMAWLPPQYADSKIGSIGIAVPNGELFLVDEHDKEIEAPNTQGEMCYRGKNVTMGYATCKADLMLGDERHGILKTGDLAYRDEDGFYFIVGRMGRFLKLFGMRIGLDECEQIIKQKYPIECACTGNDEKLIVYITDSSLVQAVKEELVAKTRLVATAFNIRVIQSIPKNEAGKVLYSKLMN